MSALAASSWSGVLIASSSRPGRARLATPVSVPPGRSSIIAVTPMSDMVAMHRSQRTGLATWLTIRSTQFGPEVTTAPSRLDSSVITGSLTLVPAAAPRRPQPRPPGRVGGELRKLLKGAAGHDLPGGVDVGRGEPDIGDGGQHGALLAAEHRGHPGRRGLAGGGHGLAADPGKRDRVGRG